MKRLSILLIFLIFSCTQTKIRSTVSIGIDPNLDQIQSIEMKNNVMGFIQDMLKEITKKSRIGFRLVNDDSRDLEKGLVEEKYQLIFSDLIPYNFNENEYTFSKNVVGLAPYPVVRTNSKIKNLDNFKNKIIGIQQGDLNSIDFKKYPNWNLKIYTSELEALNDLVNDKIDVALIGYLSALSYVEDTFYNRLKILNIPLNNQGYRFVSLKDQHKAVIEQINNNLKKNNALVKKWKLKIE